MGALDWLKERSRSALAHKMGEWRGVSLKMGQFLGMKNTGEPNPFQHSTLEVEQMPEKELIRLLKQSYPYYSRIRKIEFPGIAASLGQVHKVIWEDGRVYAMKIQYPGGEDNLKQQDKLFDWITTTMETFKNGFALNDYQKSLFEEFMLELDYEREMQMQTRAKNLFSPYSGIRIAQVFPEFSTSKILVMEWLESEPLEQCAAGLSTAVKTDLEDLLTEFFFTLLLRGGLMYSDINPGNLGYRKGPRGAELVVYDFGAVIPLAPEVLNALGYTLRLAGQNGGNALPCLKAAGFSAETLYPLRHKLPALLSILWEPFINEGRYALDRWRRKEKVEDLLGEKRFHFMIAAPPLLFPLMRGFKGYLYHLSLLNNEVYAAPLIKILLGAFAETAFPEEAAEYFAMASVMSIEVYEDGRRKVFVELPRQAVDNAEEWMDDDTLNRLKEQNIVLREIIAKARANGYGPMELFTLDNGVKRIKVQLR